MKAELLLHSGSLPRIDGDIVGNRPISFSGEWFCSESDVGKNICDGRESCEKSMHVFVAIKCETMGSKVYISDSVEAIKQ